MHDHNINNSIRDEYTVSIKDKQLIPKQTLYATDKYFFIFVFFCSYSFPHYFVVEDESEMVCEKCEKKLGKVITPDPWKTGARNTTESGGRKVNENKALTGAKSRVDPYGQTLRPCR